MSVKVVAASSGANSAPVVARTSLSIGPSVALVMRRVTRPTWFFDPAQQGDAITDVGTHLVDLIQWECFPDQTIDYKKDISIQSSKTWALRLGR